MINVAIIIATALLFYRVETLILFTIKSFKKMSEQIEALKNALAEMQVTNNQIKEVVSKVDADVTTLTEKISQTSNVPTAEEWAEIQQMASNVKQSSEEIKDALSAVDARTEDATKEETTVSEEPQMNTPMEEIPTNGPGAEDDGN